jgi:hypothetical protein
MARVLHRYRNPALERPAADGEWRQHQRHARELARSLGVPATATLAATHATNLLDGAGAYTSHRWYVAARANRVRLQVSCSAATATFSLDRLGNTTWTNVAHLVPGEERHVELLPGIYRVKAVAPAGSFLTNLVATASFLRGG